MATGVAWASANEDIRPQNNPVLNDFAAPYIR